MNLIEIRVLDRINDNIGLSTSEDVINYCRNKPLEMQTMAQEVLYCFCLDIKNKINSAELISKGNLTTSIVHPQNQTKFQTLWSRKFQSLNQKNITSSSPFLS